MPLVYDGPVLPDDLVVFVREVPLPNVISLNQILPDRTVDLNRVDVGTITKRGRTAKFRAYDGPLSRSARDAATLTQVQLPPLSDSRGMGELERLQLEFARTGGTNQDTFVNAIYNDAQDLTENIQRRMELARGDVLSDGIFTLTGEGGLTLEADYGVPDDNFVTAAISWGDHANADPIADLIPWIRAYRILNGYPPGGMILSWDRVLDLLQNENLRTLLSSVIGAPSMLTRPQLDGLLAQYSLPPILQVYDTLVDVDGTATRVTDDDKVIFVPPDPGTNLGYTAWGVSATALELVNSAKAELSFSEAPGIVGAVNKSDAPPFMQEVYVDAVGMPIIENPNALMVATVADGDS
jgi:hypothetical protein